MTKTNRLRVSVGLVVIALIAIANIIPITSADESAPIKIAYIGALSGDGASIGSENLRGVELAIAKANSHTDTPMFELIVEDDQWDEKQSVAAYNKLTQFDGVDYILGSTYGAFLTLPARVAADQNIFINALDTSEELAGLGEGTFAIGVYDESIGHTIADYLNTVSPTSTHAIILQDPFTELVSGALVDRYQGQLHIEHYTGSETDYRSMLIKNENQEHLVVIGWDETGRIVKQARELGFEGTIVGIDTFAGETFITNTGDQLDNLAFAFWEAGENNHIYTELVHDYETAYGHAPENPLFLSVGFDAANILIAAINECGDNVECVNNALKVTDHAGSTGQIIMDDDNITRSVKETMYTYTDGIITSVEQ